MACTQTEGSPSQYEDNPEMPNNEKSLQLNAQE